MKKFLVLFLLISFSTFAEEVRWEIDTDVYAGAGSNTGHKMVFEAGSGDGTTFTNAHKVYIPMQDYIVQDGSFGPASNTDYTILNPSTSVPWFEQSSNPDNNNSVVKQTLKVTTSEGDELYLWAGLKKNDSEVFLYADPILVVKKNDGVLIYKNIGIGIQELCEISLANCSPLDRKGPDNLKHNIEVVLYFFTAPTDSGNSKYVAKGETVAIADIPDGTYFKYFLSNSVDLATDVAFLDNVIKGDARLKVTYSGKKITQMNDVIGVVYSDPPPASSTFGEYPQQSYADALAAGGKLGANETGINVPGEFFVKNLTNEKEYWIGVAFVNKWYFATLVTETKSNTPEKIDTFLETRACYLVSAGFKRDHYVLDYFRGFRDRILLKNEWGKRFVEFYYSTAPKYAQIIWHNESLSKFVRIFSYFAYFLMRYFPAMALLLLAGILIRKLWPYYR